MIWKYKIFAIIIAFMYYDRYLSKLKDLQSPLHKSPFHHSRFQRIKISLVSTKIIVWCDYHSAVWIALIWHEMQINYSPLRRYSLKRTIRSYLILSGQSVHLHTFVVWYDRQMNFSQNWRDLSIFRSPSPSCYTSSLSNKIRIRLRQADRNNIWLKRINALHRNILRKYLPSLINLQISNILYLYFTWNETGATILSNAISYSYEARSKLEWVTSLVILRSTCGWASLPSNTLYSPTRTNRLDGATSYDLLKN